MVAIGDAIDGPLEDSSKRFSYWDSYLYSQDSGRRMDGLAASCIAAQSNKDLQFHMPAVSTLSETMADDAHCCVIQKKLHSWLQGLKVTMLDCSSALQATDTSRGAHVGSLQQPFIWRFVKCSSAGLPPPPHTSHSKTEVTLNTHAGKDPLLQRVSRPHRAPPTTLFGVIAESRRTFCEHPVVISLSSPKLEPIWALL